MKKILLSLALFGASTLTLAASSSFIESNIDIQTNDTLVVQPDYSQTSGSDNASLLNFSCHQLDAGRYGCQGLLRMTDLKPGYETITLGSSVTGDQCKMTLTADGQGNITFDASKSSCTSVQDKWVLGAQNTMYGVSVDIGNHGPSAPSQGGKH